MFKEKCSVDLSILLQDDTEIDISGKHIDLSNMAKEEKARVVIKETIAAANGVDADEVEKWCSLFLALLRKDNVNV